MRSEILDLHRILADAFGLALVESDDSLGELLEDSGIEHLDSTVQRVRALRSHATRSDTAQTERDVLLLDLYNAESVITWPDGTAVVFLPGFDQEIDVVIVDENGEEIST